MLSFAHDDSMLSDTAKARNNASAKESHMDQQQGNQGTSIQAGNRKHLGGCHCGAVRFQAEVDLSAGGGRCNCSVCTKTAVTSGIVKPESFQLLSGEESLSMYEWGGKISRRFFCKLCGVHCFGRGYLAEVGGDYVSVNFNCLDEIDPSQVKTIYWDGRHNNWQAGPRSTPWPIEAPSS
jgi:hypothetical protein